MSETHLCGAEQSLFGVQCAEEYGHDGPHRHEDEGGVLTWEPRYVGTLRDERDRYREALRWFADGEWTEDDPLKARDYAREVLANG